MDVLQVVGDKGSIGCNWTPVLGLQELPMLQTRPLAIACRSRHQGTTMDWEPTTQPWSRAL